VDPDLAWDDDGVCHITWAAFLPTLTGIASAPVDPYTGALLAAPHLLWQGTPGQAHQEAPHLYRIDDWWYLLLAEGGTERSHMSTIARARTLDGPWEPAQTNPILTHRGSSRPVQNAGHADLIELADGSWAAVHLGVRPRGRTPHFHVNGRETFLVGIDWVDGWPVVDDHRFSVPGTDHSFIDHFDAGELDQRWLGVGRFPGSFTEPAPGGGLTIEADDGRTAVVTRLRDVEWTAEARIDVTDGTARFAVRIDDAHSYDLTVDSTAVIAELRIGPVVHEVGRVQTNGTVPTLRISARLAEGPPYIGPDEPDLIELAATLDGTEHVFGSFDGRYLSTEVAGGFTGRVLAIEASTGRIVLREVRSTAVLR
jgi:xylan 1,4-beta-xylosidase